jgi:purine-binding chemotaxis protein CheW
MAAAPSGPLLSFRAGGRAHAVAAEAVREIVRLRRLTAVPHAPRGLAGLGNVRGRAVPILSVAALEGLPEGAGGTVLVLEREPAVGLLVESVTTIASARRGAKRLDVDALLADAYAQAPAAVATGSRVAAVAPALVPVVPVATLSLIAFPVADQLFALPLDHVAEIIALPPDIAGMPRADPAVAGTILHRGTLLALLRLDMLLGLGRDGSSPGQRVVVATLRGRRVGLLVDAVRSVVRLPEASIDPVPTVIARRSGEVRIQAIGRLPDGAGLISILAADRLFDETLMAQLEDQDVDKETVVTPAEPPETFLLFRLGAQSFGLPAAAVEAVVRIPDTLVRVPQAPAFIEGVMSLRGHAVPVIDQRTRFGAPAAPIAGKRAMLVSLGALRACFVVDAVDDVRPIARADIGEAPDLGTGPQLFDRVASLEGGERLILLIEPGQLLDGAERDLLAAIAGRTDAAPA